MRRVRSLLLAAWCLWLGGCATTLGTVAGPVSANISFFRHTHGTPAWARPLAIPFVAMVGPVIGFVGGVQTDLGFAAHGEYGALGERPFRSVIDPANPAWDRPPWR